MYAAYVHGACTYAIQPMHATIVQASGQRAQTYAIQFIHAIMIQTIDHRPLHKHM